MGPGWFADPGQPALTIRRNVLEESVLGGLKANLMHPDLVKEFVAEYHREINRLAAAGDGDRQRLAKELTTVEREIREIIDAIKSGIRGATMAEELKALESQKEELQRKLASKPEPRVRLHPNLAEIYRRKVLDLRVALNREDTREEAVAILRGLIDEIRLKAVDGQLGIYLVGNLAGILDLCTKKHPGSLGAGVQVTLVAGTRNDLYRTPPASFQLPANGRPPDLL